MNKINKNFYIYEWFNVNTNEVFYVGKGSGQRYKVKNKSSRNIYFINYINKYKCDVRKIYENLTEQEAFDLEIETIKKYKSKNQCQCNMTIGGGGVTGYTHSDEIKSIISETHKGKLNSQYKISPKERMGDNYDKWLVKVRESKNGSKNPNYKNTTLHQKYKENPKLSLEKQSRKGAQNGRAIKIRLFDDSMNFIKEFEYIGLCCEYLHKNYNFVNNYEIIRAGIRRSIKNNKPYKGFRFKKII